MFYVSIPLNSGHQFELMPTDTGISLKGLNPFEFRASVRTTDDAGVAKLVKSQSL